MLIGKYQTTTSIDNIETIDNHEDVCFCPLSAIKVKLEVYFFQFKGGLIKKRRRRKKNDFNRSKKKM